MEQQTIKNVVEFALLAAGEPLDMNDLKRLLDGAEGDITGALEELENDWEGRSMRLARVADGYQLISREGYMDYLRRLRPKKPARLSRQLMEVLAVIAYRQPATRGDIEQIRGVSVSSLQLATLEEFGWIEEVGRRATPGRPMLYGTTKTFLNDLAISTLDELPQLAPEDLAAAGLDEEGALEEEKADAGGDDGDANVSDNAADDVSDEGEQSASESGAESAADMASESEVASESDLAGDADSGEGFELDADSDSDVDSDVDSDSDMDSESAELNKEVKPDDGDDVSEEDERDDSSGAQ